MRTPFKRLSLALIFLYSIDTTENTVPLGKLRRPAFSAIKYHQTGFLKKTANREPIKSGRSKKRAVPQHNREEGAATI